ncbi:efflux transporter periplasmic adaptor subunit [Sphingomonas ginsenosidimutans]|jgi:multidrug resistance efflux pump|uniref:Efflux transporter periplasmic adaptor subunit n=1 Tax=Sphingomonas ginsenosidimutans TaxID=862134 RepID=A0A2A4HV96_9SPHN|nr:biotin/lipoyl-binding protein [Sphingomonas ginsenosidimutans]MEE2916538.1 biotin/lipoyl-binding protein [Pseudomonadota bacterium]PCG08446.1 efflux transporter periplasmic adaptor subunit [Sphingomonas ginsenosidimutans]
MKSVLFVVARYGITLAVVAIAALVGWRLWDRHQQTPWTRDGRVRADVVRVSTDVGGLVTQVMVRDNAVVHPGQLLIVLDQPRLAAMIERADAAIAEARALLEQARKEARRDVALGDLVATEAREQSAAKVRTSEAALTRAIADRNVARVDIERTEIRATVAGIVTNLDIHPGDYLAAGAQAMALVDTSSLRVEGYFEETKLRRVAIGGRARVRLMGEDGEITGHVDSIAAAIADDQRDDTGNLLPKVAPTFSWVRLAQRIPVRVHIDRLPPGVRLIAGRTATVEILPATAAPVGGRRS